MVLRKQHRPLTVLDLPHETSRIMPVSKGATMKERKFTEQERLVLQTCKTFEDFCAMRERILSGTFEVPEGHFFDFGDDRDRINAYEWRCAQKATPP